MRIPKISKQFRKDYAKLKKSGRRKIEKLHEIMKQLIRENKLHKQHKDHSLSGEWKGYRDCHIEGDWVLIYKLGFDENKKETITFHATDNHSNLFK